jgi:hypothetical protein
LENGILRQLLGKIDENKGVFLACRGCYIGNTLSPVIPERKGLFTSFPVAVVYHLTGTTFHRFPKKKGT